jgi:hypothetical protein
VFEGGAYRCSIHDVSVRDVVEIGLFVSIRLTSRGGRKAPAVASTLGSLSGGREQIPVEVVVVVEAVEREG